MARLTDEPTARMVQLAIEYDPHPPFGGIAWDQVATHRYVAQYIQTDWSNGVTTPSTAPVRRGANALWSTEDGIAEFYSMPATIAKGAVNQLAVGTNRVWYTENWGTSWVTLPTATDPRTGPVNNAQDVIATGFALGEGKA